LIYESILTVPLFGLCFLMPHSFESAALPEIPDYFPAQFPEGRFPSYGWIQRPANFPDAVWTTETTHRDGQQGGLPLTTEQSVQIYDLLCRFTGKSGRFNAP
jgi:hypothetical protein